VHVQAYVHCVYRHECVLLKCVNFVHIIHWFAFVPLNSYIITKVC